MPHYWWFPYIWYDLVEEKWHKIAIDHMGMPLKDITKLRERVSWKEANGFMKLMQD